MTSMWWRRSPPHQQSSTCEYKKNKWMHHSRLSRWITDQSWPLDQNPTITSEDDDSRIACDRDRPSRWNRKIQRLIFNFVLLRTVLRAKRHVRDQSSNTPCILHQIARRLFPCVRNSFALPLNTWIQTLVEREGRNYILNSTFVFENSEWKALHPAINWIISKATLG